MKEFRNWQRAYNYMIQRKNEGFDCFMQEFYDENGAFYCVYCF